MPVVLHAESMKLGPGGQTIRLIEEARRLNAREGWTCYVVGRSGGPLDDDLSGEPWYVPFDFRSFRLHAGAIARATRLLRETTPDVVHTHSSQDAWIFGAAARLAGIPIVRGRHASHVVPAGRVKRFVYTHLADAFTVSGRTIGSLLMDAGVAREEQVFDTGGGFDPARFDSAKRDVGFLKRELSIPGDTTILGAACTVRPTKGVDILVDALVHLRQSAPALNVHVVVAGDVSKQDGDDLSARVPGRIHFLGFRDDVEKVVGGMDVLVAPSRRADGVPQVIPQAMALGVPVIGTRAGGIPDALVHGETGFLVEPECPAALARVIHDILRMDQTDLQTAVRRAQAFSLQRYTFDSVVDTYILAYQWVLAQANRQRKDRAA